MTGQEEGALELLGTARKKLARTATLVPDMAADSQKRSATSETSPRTSPMARTTTRTLTSKTTGAERDPLKRSPAPLAVRDLAGHKQPATTARYLRPQKEAAAEVLRVAAAAGPQAHSPAAEA
jgi:hypothetical protein